MYERLTDLAQKAITHATNLAQDCVYDEPNCKVALRSSHLIVGTLREDGIVNSILDKLNCDPEKLKREAEFVACNISWLTPNLPSNLNEILETASNIADNLNCSYIGPEHFVIAIAKTDEGQNIFAKCNLSVRQFQEELENVLNGQPLPKKKTLEEEVAFLKKLLLKIKEEAGHAEDGGDFILWLQNLLSELEL